MELVEQSLSTPMAEAEGQGQQADQPAETMGDLMDVSAVAMSEADPPATLEVDTPRASDRGPGYGGVDLTNEAVEDEAVSVVEAEDEAAADDASHGEAEDEHDDEWVAAVELERDVIAELLTSGLAVDLMVRTLEGRNPAPGTLCAMVLELLRGGIEPQVIFSQLRWPEGAEPRRWPADAEPQPEVQPPPDETEHFLGDVAESRAGEGGIDGGSSDGSAEGLPRYRGIGGGSEDDEEGLPRYRGIGGGSSDGSAEDEEEAARGAARRRRRGRPGYAPLGDSDAEGEHGAVGGRGWLNFTPRWMEHFEVEGGEAEQGGAGGGGLSPGQRRSRRRRRRGEEAAGDYHELVEVGRQVSALGRQASARAMGALRGRGRAVVECAALCAAAALLAAVVALSICRLPPLHHGLDYAWYSRSLGDVHSEAGVP